ncbi:MAG: hypothetical protein HKN74_12840 [Acidimicrobiia bacterium]|nr:hypothetical protein [Acidimicrobiia bacterium]NNF11160.1 hypothetical protein [Acidimicrobiia bacterium]
MTEPATRRDEPAKPVAPARRSLVSRLSIGHVVMILAGLVAILLNLAFLRSIGEVNEVVVAAIDLPAGIELEAEHFAVAEIGDAGSLSAALVPAAAEAGLYGSILARPIGGGEPIRRSDLRPAGTTSNQREFSIELDAAQAAGGRLAAGDVVDVIATINAESFYVASTIDVVSITSDNSTLEVGDDLIIVLNVDDRQALEIASAQAAGSIAVVRSTGATPPATGPRDTAP